MKIKEASFFKSSAKVSQCPSANIPEYAFIGRSNVGKSSLINMLTNKKALAKTSSKPGKTQLINHFLINNEFYIVDLPGYGYAKVAKTDRDKWVNFTNEYLLTRTNLMCLFLLIDCRHNPQKIDLEFMEWLATNEVPFSIVFTKKDKLTDNQFNKNITNYKKVLLRNWEELPQIFITSTTNRIGSTEILNFIKETNSLFSI